MSTQPTTKEGMPAWLLRHLETKTGGFRSARWQRCKDCHELTVNGLDNDIAAVKVSVDPTPLTRIEEGFCAIVGRKTFALEVVSKKITIWSRDPLDVATPSRMPIVPAHQCGHRYAGFLLKAPTSAHSGDVPPF